MTQQIKEREQLLKRKEKELRILLQKEGKRLKTEAGRIGKIALLAGFVSLIIYSIHHSCSKEEPKAKKAKKNRPGLAARLSKVILPYTTKLILSYLRVEKNQKKA